jgi:hypothetical protein
MRPDAIAGRIDVIPAERRQAAKSLIIDGDALPTKHRFVDPKGELRADGTKISERCEWNKPPSTGVSEVPK